MAQVGTSKRLALPISLWVVRVAFLVVFVWNVQCALAFIMDPVAYCAAYQLPADAAGQVAIQGIGVAFLMWNATYPAFIIFPDRFRVLGWVILVQQLIGLVGESLILHGLGTTASVLAVSVFRFVLFDGIGLVLMGATFACMLLCTARETRLREQVQ